MVSAIETVRIIDINKSFENKSIRLNQTYIRPVHPEFELNFVKVYRRWFLENYFYPFDNIYEFGCGTGFNLVAASEIFPNQSVPKRRPRPG